MIRVDARSAVVEQLYIDQTDISFRNTARDQVEIKVTVHNQSSAWSMPSRVVIQAAPLGAFVPWRHLTSVEVPKVDPWGQVQVATQVFAPRSAPLGSFEHVSPRQLLDAVDQQRTGFAGLFSGLWGNWPLDLSIIDPMNLPEDPMALLGRSNPHWAGNINVFIGRHAVERHMAQALRIYPGRTNLAMFFVGRGTDAYAFHLTGVGAAWETQLYDMMTMRSLDSPESRSLIPAFEWIDGHKVRLVLLSICPPEGCGEGEVNIHVTQRSTRKCAVIEFSLDPHAAGTGCFAI